MILSITIPDGLYAKYTERNPENPRKEIEKTLEKFQDIPLSDRLLLVPTDVRKELEALTGSPIESWKKFLSFFKDAISIRAAEVNIPLTEGQVKRFAHQAAFFKRDPKEFISDTVKRGLYSFLGGN